MALICRNCGATLPAPGGAQEVTCSYCGATKRLELSAVQSMERAVARRKEFEPLMQALMERYAEALGSGDLVGAMRLYEPFQYLVGAMAFEVECLEELQAWAEPLLAQAADQIGVEHTPAAERGVVVTWDYASDLARG